MSLISPETLLADPAYADHVVVDCRFSLDDTERGRRAYAAGHLPGAVYVHLDADLSGPIVPGKTGRHPLPDPAVFTQKAASWGVNSATLVVAYDDAGGGIAARLWWLLRWIGHERVVVLDGGFNAWVAAGGPVATAVPTPKPGSLTARLNPALVAEAAEVEVRRAVEGFVLMDARAFERYAGRVEPIDPVAGHIPGAVSTPFSGNLGPDGRFLPVEELRARYAPYVEQAGGPSNVVCYCGSGVTAAHNLLAMARAGYPEARLYPGSWSEWILDPARPVGRE
ncbi:MAG: sulfurtransferase [Rhodothermales bacterium]|nr:sulfurtransferase [Rhodothermales bacterium]